MVDRGTPDAEFDFGGNRPGITREREAELLELWKAREGSDSNEGR